MSENSDPFAVRQGEHPLEHPPRFGGADHRIFGSRRDIRQVVRIDHRDSRAPCPLLGAAGSDDRV